MFAEVAERCECQNSSKVLLTCDITKMVDYGQLFRPTLTAAGEGVQQVIGECGMICLGVQGTLRQSLLNEHLLQLLLIYCWGHEIMIKVI